MFDLRYHVASLAAVFVALIIGILVGLGISSSGLGNPERDLLNARIADLQSNVADANARAAQLAQGQRAATEYLKQTYDAVVSNRLKGKRVAVVFIGTVDGNLHADVEQTLADSGAQEVRFRSIHVPIDPAEIGAALAGHPALLSYTRNGDLAAVGRALGREFVAGGSSPFWDALTSQLVEEQTGTRKPVVDAVVVVRTATPQRGPTVRFLAGLYSGIGDQGVPAVGVEESGARSSAVAVYRRYGLSSVDDAEQPVGRVALALLLAGAQPGHYGLKRTAESGILPPAAPLVAAATPAKPANG